MGLNMAGAAVIIPDASDGTDPENPYGDGKTYLTQALLLHYLSRYILDTNTAPPPAF